MKPIFAIAFATLYGLTIRILFVFFGDIMGIMSVSFFFLGPLAIGFLTIIFLPAKKAKSNSAAFFLPWLTCLAILVVTTLLNIEGIICWVMAYPLLAVIAGLGGTIANSIRKRKQIDINDVENYDMWTKPDKLTVSLVMLLPVLFGLGEGERLIARKDMVIAKAIIITAGPSAIMKAVANINEIKQDEKHISICTILGFPRHLQTTLDTLAVGGKRKATYENGLYFDETISRYEPGKLLVLNIRTDPSKISPAVMDEHILIGGKHLDILQDTYHLEQLNDRICRLTLSSHFFINTPFNWYAGIWADYLMNDILLEELDLVKARAEPNAGY